MEDYNRLISSRILDGYEGMIGNVSQPQMLGGKRMRNFVLPASTESDFPATLSVGRMDGQATPATLGGEFWKDFGNGFPSSAEKKGGVYYRDAKNVVHSAGQIPMKGGDIWGDISKGAKKFGKSVSKTAKKATPVLKAIGKEALPVVKELGMDLAKEGIKQGVKNAMSSKPASAPEGGKRPRGRPRKMVMSQDDMTGGDLWKDVGNIAKDVGKRAVKEGVKYGIKSATKGGVRRKKPLGADPRTYTPVHLLDGGALIRDAPAQFHSSVYPPALASYSAYGKDAYGRGRDEFFGEQPTGKKVANKVVKAVGGARAARGAIVKEIMTKKGLSLGAASKYVKENNLY